MERIKNILIIPTFYFVLASCIWLFIGGTAHAQNEVRPGSERYYKVAELIEAMPGEGRNEALKFLADAIEADNAIAIAEAKFLVGASYLLQSEPDSALKWYLEALNTVTLEEDPSLYLLILKSISAIYISAADLPNAYKYMTLSLQNLDKVETNEQINTIDVPLQIAKIKLDLAVTLLNSYLFEASANLAEPVLVATSELSRLDRAWATSLLGVAYWGMGETERSLETFERAVGLLTAEDEDREWLGVYWPYNFVLVELGMLNEAAAMIPEALERAVRDGGGLNYCYFLGNDIRIKSGLGKSQAAADQYAEYQPLCDPEFQPDSLSVRQDFELLPSVISTYQALGETDKANGLMNRLLGSQKKHFENIQDSRVEIERIRFDTDIMNAQVRYLEQQDALNDAVIARQRLLILVAALAATLLFLAAFLFGYGYLKKSRSNRTLEENASQIRDRARTAEKEIEYKDLLIVEINHRVKNNIQSIISVLNIHRRQIGSTATSATIDILNDVSNRFHSLAASQHSLELIDGVEETSVRSLITGLANKILTTASTNIDLSLDIDDIKLPSSTAAPLALIVNELISNSLKHGLNKQGGQLNIDVRQGGNKITLTCTDNGYGLPDDFEAKESLGVTIIKSLTRKLNGNVTFSKINPGTKVQIDFPCTDFPKQKS